MGTTGQPQATFCCEGKKLKVPVTLGEPLAFLTQSVIRSHFSNVTYYMLYQASEPVPDKAVVDERVLAQDLLIRRQRELAIQTPFGKTHVCKAFWDETMHALFSVAAKNLCVATSELTILQSGKQLRGEDLIRELDSSPLTVQISPIYPTLYIIEGGKVLTKMLVCTNLGVESLVKLVNEKGANPAEEPVLMFCGRRVTVVPYTLSSSFVFLCRQRRGEITVLAKCEGKPAIALDLNTDWEAGDVVKKLAMKLNILQTHLKVISQGKVLTTGKLHHYGIEHGQTLWVCNTGGKCVITLRWKSRLLSIDALSSDSVATAKQQISRAYRIPVAQQVLAFKGRELEDENTLPSECFTVGEVLTFTTLSKIFVRTLSGKVARVFTLESTDLADLRKTLVETRVLNSERCRLEWNNIELTDGWKVRDLNSYDRVVIHADCL